MGIYQGNILLSSGGSNNSDITIPEVTTEDNGKFLRVVDGVWTATSLPNAEEADF